MLHVTTKNELSVVFYLYKQEFGKLKFKLKYECLIFHYFHNFMMKFWSHFTTTCSFSPTRTVFFDLFSSIDSLAYLLPIEMYNVRSWYFLVKISGLTLQHFPQYVVLQQCLHDKMYQICADQGPHLIPPPEIEMRFAIFFFLLKSLPIQISKDLKNIKVTVGGIFSESGFF